MFLQGNTRSYFFQLSLSLVVSGVHVSASALPPAGSPPTSRGANGTLFSHRNHLHRGSLDSFALASGGGGGGPRGGTSGELSNDNLADTPAFLHHHPHTAGPGLGQHLGGPGASIALAAAAAGKARAERVSEPSPSSGIPGRSPVMVAVDSSSSSDHDEDYPRLRRDPIASNPSGVLRWLDAQERLHDAEVDADLPALSAGLKSLSLRIDARDTPGVEPSPGGSLLKTSGAAKDAEPSSPYRSTILLTLRNEHSEVSKPTRPPVLPHPSTPCTPNLLLLYRKAAVWASK